VAEALWVTLRGGRGAADEGEQGIAPAPPVPPATGRSEPT
jgi:hypothetical protein